MTYIYAKKELRLKSIGNRATDSENSLELKGIMRISKIVKFHTEVFHNAKIQKNNTEWKVSSVFIKIISV